MFFPESSDDYKPNKSHAHNRARFGEIVKSITTLNVFIFLGRACGGMIARWFMLYIASNIKIWSEQKFVVR